MMQETREKSRHIPFWMTEIFLLTLLCFIIFTGLIVKLTILPIEGVSSPKEYLLYACICILFFLHYLPNPGFLTLKWGVGLYLFGLFSLLFVLLLGNTELGATRWISFAGFQLQPSEFSKIFLVIGFALILFYRRDIDTKTIRMMYVFGGILIPGALLVGQPAFSMAGITCTALWFVAFILETKNSLITAGLLIIIVCIVIYFPNLFGQHLSSRIESWFDIQKNLWSLEEVGGGNQQHIKALRALAESTFWGEKYIKPSGIPFAANDYVFAASSKHFGVFWTTVVFCLVFFWFAFSWFVVVQEKNMLVFAVFSGLWMILALNFIFHVSINVGLFPPSGIALPFFSAGGSNFLSSTFIACFIMKIISGTTKSLGGYTK